MARKKWNHDWMFRGSDGRYKSKSITVEDDYSEESGSKIYNERPSKVKFSSDKYDPKTLNGPVIIVQEGRKKDG